MDKRFGDICVEKGYLSEQQVSHLLRLQGNTYLVFLQTLIDKEYVTMQEYDTLYEEFQREYGYTMTQMDALKSCDIDRILNVYIEIDYEKCHTLLGMLLRTAARLIDYHIYIEPPKTVTSISLPLLSTQMLHGDFSIFSAIGGNEEAFRKASIAFAGESLIEEKEDSLDAMCEFLHCVNVLYASTLSNQHADIDMLPPEYYNEETTLEASEIFVVSMYVCGEKLDYILTINEDIKLR